MQEGVQGVQVQVPGGGAGAGGGQVQVGRRRAESVPLPTLLQLLHCVLHHTSRVLLLLSVADSALLSSFSTSSTP